MCCQRIPCDDLKRKRIGMVDKRSHVQLCFMATLSQRECVGASVTSAADRCALCRGEVCMQIDTRPQLGQLRQLRGSADRAKL